MNRVVGRFVDPGAIFAGWVGVGMAMTIAVSFLLVIPIEPVFWLMAPLAGVLIGYFADDGYRDASQGGPIVGCVYARYLAEDGKAAQSEQRGITDVASFTAFYWREQLGTTGTVTILCLAGGLLGAAMYGFARPKPPRPAAAPGAPSA